MAFYVVVAPFFSLFAVHKKQVQQTLGKVFPENSLRSIRKGMEMMLEIRRKEKQFEHNL
jgi:hypothetical protein